MKQNGMNSWDSWLATLACTLISFLIVMPIKLSGLLFVEILGRFDTDRATASYPLFLCMLINCSGGPLSGYCGERFGLHSVILAGCIFSSVGVGVCFLAENITAVIIFLGLVYGFGVSTSMTLFPQVLKEHFNMNLTLAISMSMLGSDFGGFIIPPIMKWIFQSYGVSGTFLIMGGIMLNSLPFAVLLKYLKPKKGLAPSGQKEGGALEKEADDPVASATTIDKLKSVNIGKKKNIERKEECVCCACELEGDIKSRLAIPLSSRQVTGEDLASLNNGCQTHSSHIVKHPTQDPELGNDSETLEQIVALLPKPVESFPSNTAKKDDDPVAAVTSTDKLKSADIEEKKNIGRKEEYCAYELESSSKNKLPSRSSSRPMNGEDLAFVNNGCQTDSNHLVKHPTQDSELRKDNETLEQTVALLPKPVESVLAKTEKKAPSAEVKTTDRKTMFKHNAAMQSLSIVKDLTFIIILITQSLECIVQILTMTTLLDYSRDKGIDRSYEVYFMMFLQLAQVVGRVFLSMLIDRDYITKLNFTIISFNVQAAAVLIMAWSKTFPVMMVGVVVFGLVMSGLFSVFPVLVFQFIEPKNYIMALASRTFLYGPLSFLCAPLIGHFRGRGGSYDWVYYIQAIILVFCAILTVFTPHCAKRRDQKGEKKREMANLDSPINA
ncbi:unnamed protein product [Larinioides sclopetarius]|uniref:Monocarboxylate transporter n=1 Tax=Larinioides sclopetarius TaxID=280406 RepID=A0AAV2BPK2_9ARAC